VLKYLCDIEKSVIFKQISIAMKNGVKNCSFLKKMGAVVVFQTPLVRQAKNDNIFQTLLFRRTNVL
jgi:hypothetical protein